MACHDLIASLQRQFPGKVGQGREFRDENGAVDVDREIVRAVAAYLKSDQGLNFLVDISSVDHYRRRAALRGGLRIPPAWAEANDQVQLRVKTRVSEDDATSIRLCRFSRAPTGTSARSST